MTDATSLADTLEQALGLMDHVPDRDEVRMLVRLSRPEILQIIKALRNGEKMKEALMPFADVAEYDIGDDESDADKFRPIAHNNAPHIRVGDLRRARKAIQDGDEK